MSTTTISGCTASSSTTTAAPGTTTSILSTPTTTEVSSSTATSSASSTTSSTGAPSGETQSQRLTPNEGPFAQCPDCHAYLDVPGKIPPTLTAAFSHGKHLAYPDVACEDCHRTPVHRAQGVRRPTMAECFTCHGLGANARAPGECDVCHPKDFPRKPASHTAAFVTKEHPAVAEDQGRANCIICHEGTEETVCRDCHGVDLPHPAGWTLLPGGAVGAHADASYKNGKLCARCHDNQTDIPGNCYGGECHAL